MVDSTQVPNGISASEALDEALDPSPMVQLRRRIFRHHSFLIGMIVILLILGVALFAPLLAPHDPYEQELSSRLKNPFWHEKKHDEDHLLGTDNVGRDYLSRLIYGVPAVDPVTFGGVVVLIGSVSFLAAWIPARRATRVSPVTALRSE